MTRLSVCSIVLVLLTACASAAQKGEAHTVNSRQYELLKKHGEASKKAAQERKTKGSQSKQAKSSQSSSSSLLAPISGVSLEQYAKINNAIEYEGLKESSGSTGTAERVTRKARSAWTVRIASDRSVVLLKKYQAAYFAQSRGRFAASGKEAAQALQNDAMRLSVQPISIAEYQKIQLALQPFSGSSGDPQTLQLQRGRVLSSFGITQYEWNIISAWWGLKEQRDPSLQ